MNEFDIGQQVIQPAKSINPYTQLLQNYGQHMFDGVIKRLDENSNTNMENYKTQRTNITNDLLAGIESGGIDNLGNLPIGNYDTTALIQGLAKKKDLDSILKGREFNRNYQTKSLNNTIEDRIATRNEANRHNLLGEGIADRRMGLAEGKEVARIEENKAKIFREQEAAGKLEKDTTKRIAIKGKVANDILNGVNHTPKELNDMLMSGDLQQQTYAAEFAIQNNGMGTAKNKEVKELQKIKTNLGSRNPDIVRKATEKFDRLNLPLSTDIPDSVLSDATTVARETDEGFIDGVSRVAKDLMYGTENMYDYVFEDNANTKFNNTTMAIRYLKGEIEGLGDSPSDVKKRKKLEEKLDTLHRSNLYPKGSTKYKQLKIDEILSKI